MLAKVLVADDDPVARGILVRLLQSRGYECVVVDDGHQAWEVAQRPDAPRIMFLDWMMPGVEGPELCRRIRQLDRPFYSYVVLISGRTKRADINVGFAAGIDDFITKPFRNQEVFTRLAVAQRVLRTLSPEVTLSRAITEAKSSTGGDILVRSGSIVGRILFHLGKVAWAHVSNEPGSLHAMLSTEPTVSREAIRSVLDESASTGVNFAEVIVKRGLLDHMRLRQLMKHWIRDKIHSIASLPQPSIVFIPEQRDYAGEPFEIADVFPSHILAKPEDEAVPDDVGFGDNESVHPVEDDIVAASLSRALSIEGAVSAALFDGSTGRCLGALGESIDMDLAWRKLKLASAGDAWDEIEDIIVTTHQHHYILRRFSIEPARFMFLATNRNHAALGLVRVGLAACAGQLRTGVVA